MKLSEDSMKLIITSMIVSFIVIVAFFSILPYVANAGDAEILCDDCCDSAYTDYYKCSDNEVQRLYQYSDCTREWRLDESCRFGCKDGQCLECSTEFTEVSVFPVSDMFEDNTVKATIKVHNEAENGRLYYLDVKICRSVGGTVTDCRKMELDKDSVYVGSGSTSYVKASEYMGTPGLYKINVFFSINSYESSSVKNGCDRDIDSNVFKVFAKHETDAYLDGNAYIDEYRCFGNYVQQRYSKAIDGEQEWRWKVTDYCESGCQNGDCIVYIEQSAGKPEIFTQSEYILDRCEIGSIPFSITNRGESDSFEIGVDGEISEWMEVVPTVDIGKGETKSMIAYASLPCDLPSGDYGFTIRVAGGTEDTYDGTITVEKEKGLFSTGVQSLFYMALLFLAFFVALLFYKNKLVMIGTGIKGRAKEEKFR